MREEAVDLEQVGVGASAAESIRPEVTVSPSEQHFREPRHVHAIPASTELKLAKALELFNGSDHVRTVSGVARSLGDPLVSVRVANGHAGVVVITVSWELCWYRYEVDLAEESEYSAVAQVAQGADMVELELEERNQNAVAKPDGSLGLQGS